METETRIRIAKSFQANAELREAFNSNTIKGEYIDQLAKSAKISHVFIEQNFKLIRNIADAD